MVGKEKLEALCGEVALENFPAAKKISKVKVEYKRYYKFPCQDDNSYRLQTKRGSDPSEEVSNFGGSTRVILRIDDHEYVGSSKCSKQDNFCRQTGLRMATLRAFRVYRERQKVLAHL